MCLVVLIDGQSASHFTAWIIIPNRDCLAPFMYPLSCSPDSFIPSFLSSRALSLSSSDPLSARPFLYKFRENFVDNETYCDYSY